MIGSLNAGNGQDSLPRNQGHKTNPQYRYQLTQNDHRGFWMTFTPRYEFYPLSPLQQGMLFHALTALGSGVDIEQILCTVQEPLDLQALRSSWARVLKRHPILRTRFQWEGLREPLQVVEPHVDLKLECHNWHCLSPGERSARIEEVLHADRLRDFKMNEAPLMRLALFELGKSEYQFLWTFHHALLDGRSFPLVLRELFSFYEAFMENLDLQLEQPRPYRDYIEWLQQRDLTQDEMFWRQTLKGFTAPTPLAVAGLTGSDRMERGHGAEEISLSAMFTSALRSFASEHELTLNTLIQGTWALLLHHYSGKDDVVYGATRACRHSTIEAADSMVGLFINTLPMRVQITPTQPLLSWLKQLRKQHLSLRKYENTPLPDVQRWSEVPSGTPLFESIVVFEERSLNSILQAQGGRWLNREFLYRGQTNYPLTLISYADAELLLRIEYNRQRFVQTTIRHMLGHIRTLLEGMLNSANVLATALPYITRAERQQLLVEWNPTWTTGPVEQCVHQRFEQQVEATPDAVALVFEGRTCTYRELNLCANRLAHRLRALGVGPETLVGLFVERSLEMVVGVLGILKSGGAYVPLDPTYPQERITFMLEDMQASVLVTQESMLPYLPPNSAEILCLDNADTKSTPYDETDDENPVSGVKPENLAYVIYTSGSTGKPNGVLVTHRNVMRLFEATDSWFHFGPEDVWTLFHSCAFDFSVWELWGALFYGGRLVIISYDVSRSPRGFYKLLLREGVTVLNQTPSAFYQLIQAEEMLESEDDLALRLIIFGGEALELQYLKPWIKRHGDKRPQLVNMYGITETTVHVTYRPLTAEDVQNGLGSVIGVPIPDLQLYVLDQYLRPVPIGIAGELYVGGAGLARGYLNRPELNAERFIPNPFNSEPGARLYITGDVVRYLFNRDLEYIGRADQQVQIRGFRVELGEIEAVMTEHEAVSQTVVVVQENQPEDQRLVAYFVPQSSRAVAVSELRKHLQTKLPKYMIPHHFVQLDALPLTPNGKVDRRALPPPPEERQAEEAYVAPRNEVEKMIAHIWQELLHVRTVGVHDSFFDLGGHSLLLVKMLGRLQESSAGELSIVDFFRYPTVETLAKFLTQEQDVKPSFAKTQELVKKQKESLKRQKQLPSARSKIHEQRH